MIRKVREVIIFILLMICNVNIISKKLSKDIRNKKLEGIM